MIHALTRGVEKRCASQRLRISGGSKKGVSYSAIPVDIICRLTRMRQRPPGKSLRWPTCFGQRCGCKGSGAGGRSLVGPGVSRNRKTYRAPRTSGQLTALTYAAGGLVTRLAALVTGPARSPFGEIAKIFPRAAKPTYHEGSLRDHCSGYSD
jgi:hypothetical protein